jgi:flagellum-specific peptidoglycan hydrolase FlgJ
VYRKHKQTLIALILIVTVFITMGMILETKMNSESAAISTTSVEANSKVQITEFSKLPLLHQSIKRFSTVSLKSSVEVSQNLVQTTEKELDKELPSSEVVIAKYEVTSDFLNVRENALNTSKILQVVQKGTLLNVLKTTENGWLQLEGEGYVLGKYANILSGNVKKSDQVTILSVQHTTDTQAVKLPTQPAIRNEAPLKPTSTVKSDSGLTEAHIEEIFKGTSLANNGLEKAILQIEEEYGINAYFTIAVMKLESGNGKSSLAKNKNNLFGLNAIDGDQYNKAFSFKTKGESVQMFGQLISDNYVGKGYTTIKKVSDKYCNSNPDWTDLVESIMDSDYRKL